MTYQQPSQEKLFWRNLAIVFGAVTAGFYIVYLIAAIDLRNMPFLGATVSHTLTINAAAPSSDIAWTGLSAGLRRQDYIVAIDGERFTPTPADMATARDRYNAFLRTRQVGDVVEVEFVRNVMTTPHDATLCAEPVDGFAECRVSVELMRLPEADFLAFFILSYGSGLIVLLMSMALLYYRGNKRESLSAVFIGYTTSVFMGGLFDVGTMGYLIPFWVLIVTGCASALVTFGLIFPTQLRLITRYPRALYVPLGVGLLVGTVIVWNYFNPSTPYDNSVGQNTTTMAVVGLLMNTLLMASLQRPRAVTVRARRQVDIVLIGSSLMLVPTGLWLLNRLLLVNAGFSALFSFEVLMPLFVFPNVANTFAILQYQRIDTDRIISQSLTYGIMLSALILSVFLLALGASLIALDLFNANGILSISIILFVMVMFFTPFRNRLQDRIDALYFRARRNYGVQVEAFGQRLAVSNRYEDIVAEFERLLEENIAPNGVFLFVKVGEGRDYEAYQQTTSVRFTSDSPLIKWLSQGDSTLIVRADEPIPSQFYTEESRLRALRAHVVAPLQGASGLNGFVVVQAPRSGKATYSFEEVRFLSNLIAQLALGTERAQVISSLERRVRELDVLSQVGQAVNFTIAFDDLLELINAQTTKLVNAPHFYIALYETATQQLYFAFLLEGDDRLSDKENKRWTLDEGLFSEVIKSGKPLRVENYGAELQKRGIRPRYETAQMRAWMGVPLSAGGQPLGVLAVGKLKAGDNFTDEQYKIFSDIGSLAATSIDKARLFTETKLRERQLTVLNDISRRLVATESDVEKLLQIIMSSAVEIINTEAGSLLLTAEDDDTKLEFRVVIGGAEDLLGTRIDAHKGIAGQVVKTGKPLAVNDVTRDPNHNQQVTDEFNTQSLLAVPLIAKDRVIGVLEVLNKRDRTPFTQSDIDLLTTFSGQAAVAIENARLFRMTDIQLAQRVRELEALERIDSELNRTLDVSEVASVTVKSALQILNAQAGALGIVHESDGILEIVGIEGYTSEEYPDGANGLMWSLDSGIVARVMRTKQPDLAPDVSIDPNYKGKLKGALSQITLPMFSGDELNAMLILVRTQMPRFALNDWAFAQRLAEHASIAIANAQLYAALTRANKSKSEFMGFAAHELKNPLSSLKGYAEVLLTGMTGQLTDQQRSFIGIIQSNANRMQTIIEDLRDSARMDANEFSVNVSPMNIHHAVIETLRPFTQVMADKSQQLVNAVRDDLPLIMGDETRLIQVLTNLVSNANKYSPPNTKITISADVIDNYIDQRGKRRGAVLRVSVIDEGLGMSKEDQARLFKERYFRSTNKLALEQPGTGLGMMLTFGIMQKHGGDIWVESELGKGSKFHIAIPIAPQQHQTRLNELASD